MWNVIYGSAKGTSHQRTGKPCQDYCTSRVVESAAGPVLIAACADGAGSAELAEVGARLAVETLVANADTALVQSGLTAPAIDRDVAFSWFASSRNRITFEALDREVTVRQLACTLLTAVVGPTTAVFAQIGDGVIVFDNLEGYRFAFWPDSGEYANTTRFLTDPDYNQHVQFERIDRCVRDVAILTDGLQRLALSYAEGRVHDPFFKPMFEVLRAAPSGESLRESLEEFLNSPRVNERTDDDKTLILATRIPTTDHAPISSAETD